MRGIRFYTVVMRWRHALRRRRDKSFSSYSTRSVRGAHKLPLVFIADRSTLDSCPREPTAAWAAHLRSEHPTFLSRAASSFLPPPVAHDLTKGKGKRNEPLDDAWGLDAVSNLLGHWAQEKTGERLLHVAVVGLTSVRSYSFSLLFLELNSGAIVREERIYKFPCTQVHTRRLHAFLKHQQPDNYATRPRSDTRTRRCTHPIH
jgi:hypothetical protein